MQWRETKNHDNFMAKTYIFIYVGQNTWSTSLFSFTLQTIIFKEKVGSKWYQMHFFSKIPSDKVSEGQQQAVSKRIGQLGGNATSCQLLVQLMTFCT